MESDNEYLVKKIGILSRALIVSGAINIGVLGLLSYWMIRESPPTPYFELKPKKQESLISHINAVSWSDQLAPYSAQTFSQLAERLGSNQVIGNQYSEKEIALAFLIAFHHFDLQRALKPNDIPKQKHLIKWTKENGSSVPLIVYPSLTNEDYTSIIQFMKTERWPLTAQGLFYVLRKQKAGNTIDPNLIETFALTPEFWSMELLLSRNDQSLSKLAIAEMLAQGSWPMLKQFADQQREMHDLSDERRHRVLLDYVQKNSPLAAELLLKLDWEYSIKQLNEEQIIAMLNVLDNKTMESERFAKELLASPRSKRIWQKATERLYAYAGEQVPEDWNYQMTLARFVYPSAAKPLPLSSGPLLVKSEPKKNNLPIVKKPVQIPQPKSQVYTVQKGDSLWKISRKFNVSVVKIKEINKLQSDNLKPGSVLRIPN